MRSLGAEDVVNYNTHQDWDREVLRLTDGFGVDRVIEIGGSGTLTRSMHACAINGRVVVIGVLAGDAKIDPSVILGRRLTVQAISTGSREMFEQMNGAIARWRLRPVIDRIFAFEAVQERCAVLCQAGNVSPIRRSGPCA